MASSTDRLSLRQLRFRGQAPRVALLLGSVVLSCLGLKDLLDASTRAGVRIVREPVRDAVAAEGLAQLFARAYLGARGAAPNLERFGFPTDAVADVRPGRAAETVAWTTVVGSRPTGSHGRVVTVGVGSGGAGTSFLAVRLHRDNHGRWAVQAPPALVGRPASTAPALSRPAVEVEDPGLRSTAARVIRHYLAGESDDLSADLTGGTRAVTPTTALRLRRVEAVTWTVPGRQVAIEVSAGARDGRRLTLRYELPVARVGGRWLALGVDTPPTAKEVVR